MKKDELQVGQLVKLRDDTFRMVMPVGTKGSLILLGEGGVWDYLSRWDEMLYEKVLDPEEVNRDIIAVYGFVEGRINYGGLGYLEPTYRRLIWERKPPEIIAVDFDGTLCENKWPEIGKPNHEILRYINYRKHEGAKLILWSCRSDKQLKEAVDWCKKFGIKFDAINENLPESVEHFGEDTRKIYATEYIDDKSCTKFKLPFKAD